MCSYQYTYMYRTVPLSLVVSMCSVSSLLHGLFSPLIFIACVSMEMFFFCISCITCIQVSVLKIFDIKN